MLKNIAIFISCLFFIVVSSAENKIPRTGTPSAKEAEEVYKQLPPEHRPIIGVQDKFTYGDASSNIVSLVVLENFDLEFVEQTGDGISRALGTARLIALVALAYLEAENYPPQIIRKLSNEEKDALADTQIVKFLVKKRSPRGETYMRNSEQCIARNVCGDTITSQEIVAFVQSKYKKIKKVFKRRQVAAGE